jgi:hypothetical protein
LQYDLTAEESGASEPRGVGSRFQIAKNTHAVLAVQALSHLRGSQAEENTTPYNDTASKSLKALLTPKLAAMFDCESPIELLRNLNANLETPEVGIAAILAITPVISIMEQLSVSSVINLWLIL